MSDQPPKKSPKKTVNPVSKEEKKIRVLAPKKPENLTLAIDQQTKSDTFTMRIEPWLLERFKDRCKASYERPGDVLRRAVLEFIEKTKQNTFPGTK